MDERRCVEVLREVLQYTMGTGVLVDEEREALDHAIATIERVAGAPSGEVWQHAFLGGQRQSHVIITREPEDGLAIIGQRVRLVPDPQPDGQEGA